MLVNHTHFSCGKKMWKLDTEGAFIGFEKELNSYYKSKKIKLASLDKIIIYTDGICEATNSNNEQYSIKRLQRAVLKNNSLSCNKLLESVISDLSTFTHKATRKDDETLIIIEMKQLEKNSLA